MPQFIYCFFQFREKIFTINQQENPDRIALNPVNQLTITSKIRKIGTLATTFDKTAGESNIYVWFVYIPQTILNPTQGQVSVSMNEYLLNAKLTSKNE